MSTVRKNGKAYDSADAIITMFGSDGAEVDAITYNTEQEHQKNYVLGSTRAKSWSMGKVSDEGSITLYMSTVVQFEKLAKNGDLMSIKPFDVQVTFANEYNEIVNDTIVCKFMDQGREVTGEMGLKRAFKLFVLEVKYSNN